MIVVLKSDYTAEAMDRVSVCLREGGYTTHPIIGEEKTILLGIGGGEHAKVDLIDQLRGDPSVEEVIVITRPYKLVAREMRPEGTQITWPNAQVGGQDIALMAGPCTVESEDLLMETAAAVAQAGGGFLRGGAYKPTTSPYSFQGMGEEGLRMLRDAADAHGLRVITEVMDVRKVDLVASYADVLQIGARNMQNYDLLKEVGMSRVPVMLKRGFSAKIEEWLLAAEYICSAGNENVMMCERGIRTFETSTRNTLDLNAIPLLKAATHLPIIVDPSHGTGRRDLVPAMAKAAIACGADGLMLEVHPNPNKAIKDGSQTIGIDTFSTLIPELRLVAEAVGRSLRPAKAAVS